MFILLIVSFVHTRKIFHNFNLFKLNFLCFNCIIFIINLIWYVSTRSSWQNAIDLKVLSTLITASMPFCLSNVPSIWLIDDILRDFIGIICNVYMDDIVIYSPNENSHLLHVEQVISVLEKGGMRISPEKHIFF